MTAFQAVGAYRRLQIEGVRTRCRDEVGELHGKDSNTKRQRGKICIRSTTCVGDNMRVVGKFWQIIVGFCILLAKLVITSKVACVTFAETPELS